MILPRNGEIDSISSSGGDMHILEEFGTCHSQATSNQNISTSPAKGETINIVKITCC